MVLRIQVFWVVMLSGRVSDCLRFGGRYRWNSSRTIWRSKTETIRFFETSGINNTPPGNPKDLNPQACNFVCKYSNTDTFSVVSSHSVRRSCVNLKKPASISCKITVIFTLSFFFLTVWRNSPTRAQAASLLRFPGHTHTHTHTHTVGLLWTRDQPVAEAGPYLHKTRPTQRTNIRALSGIRIRYSRNQAVADLRLKPH